VSTQKGEYEMSKLSKLALAVTLLFSTVVMAEEAKPIPPQTLFINVNIFNGTDDKLLAGNVLVENNLIKLVSTKPIPVNRSAKTRELFDNRNKS